MTAIAEVLSLPIALLEELPAPTTLVCTFGEHRAYFTTSEDRGAALYAAREVCCGPPEYRALAIALGDGRLSPIDALIEFGKKREGVHVLELERLLGQAPRQRRCAAETTKDVNGATRNRSRGSLVTELEGGVRAPDGEGDRWTFGELFAALGVELVEVEVEA